MIRGEVWWANFDPSVVGEIRKVRPAVIISNNSANRYLNRVQVVPLSSNVKRLYPSEVLVFLRSKPNKAMTDQLTTISKLRITNFIGCLSEPDMTRTGHAMMIHLSLR
ncbi:growth inhibitor [Synechococcus sp. PCC 6312]|nr:growth inhibitor [Synechococcus sp. PCC 6312]